MDVYIDHHRPKCTTPKMNMAFKPLCDQKRGSHVHKVDMFI